MKKLICLMALLMMLVGCNESRATDGEYVESLPTYTTYEYRDQKHGWKQHIKVFCIDGYEYISHYDSTLTQVYERGVSSIDPPQPKECTRGVR